jgi:hypothetical protein
LVQAHLEARKGTTSVVPFFFFTPHEARFGEPCRPLSLAKQSNAQASAEEID